MTTTSNRELPATEALILSLDEYIRARYGLLAVQTFEEERFIRFMRGVAEHERHRAKGLYLWSRTRGLSLVAGPGVGAEPRLIPNREDALSVIEYIEEAEQGLYVLSDFAPYLLEYGAPKPELVRRLRELAWAIRSRPVTNPAPHWRSDWPPAARFAGEDLGGLTTRSGLRTCRIGLNSSLLFHGSLTFPLGLFQQWRRCARSDCLSIGSPVARQKHAGHTWACRQTEGRLAKEQAWLME
jgi:hypothetical protein